MARCYSLTWVAVLTLLVGGPSKAATIDVPPDDLATAERPAIQVAIDSASPGDEIVLQPGVHIGCCGYGGKAITVRSMNPCDPAAVAATVVLGYGGECFTFYSGEGRDSVLAGVTLVGAEGDWSSTWYEGAIACSGSPTIRDCVFDGNGNGVVTYGNALVQRCIFQNTGAAAISVQGGSPTIDGCLIRDGNTAIYCQDGNPTISRCTIIGNQGLWGAAAGVLGGSVTVRDSLIMGNSVPQSPLGPACTFGLYGGSLTVENCTITGNSGGFARIPDAQASGGGHGPLILRNTILWGNPGGPVLPDPAASAAPVEVSYSVVEGGCAGTAVLDVNPKLLTSGRLARNSPCINAGDPEFLAAPGTEDIDGQPRVLGGRVDIGADEVTKPGDLNGDGLVNAVDLNIVAKSWNLHLGQGGYDPRADASGDNRVSVVDLNILAASWGK